MLFLLYVSTFSSCCLIVMIIAPARQLSKHKPNPLPQWNLLSAALWSFLAGSAKSIRRTNDCRHGLQAYTTTVVPNPYNVSELGELLRRGRRRFHSHNRQRRQQDPQKGIHLSCVIQFFGIAIQRQDAYGVLLACSRTGLLLLRTGRRSN